MALSIKPKGHKTVDPVIGERLLNACWLLASWGGATLQFRLFAQALAAVQALAATQYLGTLLAGMGLAWLLGKWIGRALPLPVSTLTLGIWLLAVSLVWLGVPALGLMLSTPTHTHALALTSLALLSILLAQLSTAWTGRARPWPAVREGIAQLSRLVRVLVGLSVTWLLPGWAGAIGILLLLPLLIVDLWPSARCPRPRPTRPASIPPTGQTDARRARVGWWWAWLASRRQLSLALLGSAVTVVLTSVCLVVPTLYARGLEESHALGTLAWLLGGQACAVLLGAWIPLTRTGKRLLAGTNYHFEPAGRRAALSLAGVTLLLAALGLAALGRPWYQAPWLLGLATAGSTLPIAIWQRLYPRLLRGAGRSPGGEERLAPWTHPALVGGESLPRMRAARDASARRCLSRWESAFLAGAVLLTGSLSDQWGIDAVLGLAGCALVGAAATALFFALHGGRWSAPAAAQGRHVQPLRETPAEQAHAAPHLLFFPREGRYEASEPRTTAQHQVISALPQDEPAPGQMVARYTPLPLEHVENGDQTPDGNGSGIH